jgi:hypothetical protein
MERERGSITDTEHTAFVHTCDDANAKGPMTQMWGKWSGWKSGVWGCSFHSQFYEANARKPIAQLWGKSVREFEVKVH